MMRIKVGVAGACGRMGLGIVKAIYDNPGMDVVLAVDPNNVGKDIGALAGLGEVGVAVTAPQDIDKALMMSGTQVLVDFTHRDAVLKNAGSAAKKGVHMVIGTTGLDMGEMEELKDLLGKKGVSAVVAPNMAVGVNIFFKLVEEAALMLGSDFDVEIIETHHRFKKDSPSGTAKRTAEGVARVLGLDLERAAKYGREGTDELRVPGEIGIHSVRGGKVFGDHSVIFAGDAERIEITHRADSREPFIKGVLKAVRFMGNPPEKGIIFDMWDVLGIR